jgi:modulator of FtsH protease
MWHDFFAASAVASAAILGLLFVAMTLHVSTIAQSAVMQVRSRFSIQALVGLVLLALVVLLPGQANWVLGSELMAILVVYLVFLVFGLVGIAGKFKGVPRASLIPLLTQNSLLLLLLAGAVSLIAGIGPGLYLIVPVVLFALPVTIYNTWNTLFSPEA